MSLFLGNDLDLRVQSAEKQLSAKWAISMPGKVGETSGRSVGGTKQERPTSVFVGWLEPKFVILYWRLNGLFRLYIQ